MDTENLDQVRRRTLDEIDVAERRLKQVIAVAALVEMALLCTFIVLMDFGNRLHWLILVAAVLVYAIIAVGLVALGVYNRTLTLRVLRALDAASHKG